DLPEPLGRKGERAHRRLPRRPPLPDRPPAPRLARAHDDLMKKLVLPLAAALVAVLWIAPYAWMVATSFKPLAEITAHPTAPLPEHPRVDAYREVFASIDVGRYLAVTLVMATAIAVLQILLA